MITSEKMIRAFQYAIVNNASDINVNTDKPLYISKGSRIIRVPDIVFNKEDVDSMMKELLSETEFQKYSDVNNTKCIDKAVEIKSKIGEEIISRRLRMHLDYDIGGVSVTMRIIPHEIPEFEKMNLPYEPLINLLDAHSGLIIIGGQTGSGKTTTLASIIRYLNENLEKKIIMMEDPVEYVHEDIKCLITQREVGMQVATFDEGVKNALREAPHIIVVGEGRSRETIENAIVASETGHLVFMSVHFSNIEGAIERILSPFDEREKGSLRSRLSATLKGLIHQEMYVNPKGGKLPILEVVPISSPIASQIKERGVINRDTLASTRSVLTRNKHLIYHLKDGKIANDEMIALVRADEIESLNGLIKSGNWQYIKPM